MSKQAKLFLILVLCAVVAGALYYYGREKETQGTNQLTIYGNIDIRQIQLAFFDEGRIEKLMVEEGQQVKKGELLATLDPSRYQAAVEALKAQVEAQKQLVKKLLAGTRPQNIKAAWARVLKAKAQLANAKITYRRLKALSKTKYVSQQRLDNARAQLDMAKAALEEAQQLYDLAVKGPREEDIQAAKAKLQALKAQLKLAQEKLKDTRLYSPAPGIIRDRILEPGDMAFPSRPVYTLALTNPLWVRAYIPETDLGKISLGLKAKIKVDSFPDEEFQGWIGYISPTAEFTPRNVETPDLRTRLVYQVRVYVCNSNNKLRLGMPATVIIDLKDKRHIDTPSQICQESQDIGS